MKCPSCGRENAEENNFCFYCGHCFRESVVVADEPKQVDNVSSTSVGEAKAMPAWQWCVYFLLLMFPYTWIVWFVITMMWAFGDKASAERKGMARGVLSMLVVLIILGILLSIVLISTLGTDGAIEYLTGGVATNAEALMEMYGVQ